MARRKLASRRGRKKKDRSPAKRDKAFSLSSSLKEDLDPAERENNPLYE
jgi:hypothetical protein